jgi:hypothetical protein
MNRLLGTFRRNKKKFITLFFLSISLFAWHFYAFAQDKTDFPEGYDAVQAAPKSHKVIFENELVRVLEVTVPPPGTTEPMHHHRWPSFFISWNTGGGTPHIRYHRGNGEVRDSPSVEEPAHPGAWSAHWMKPEPMHAIEVVDLPKADLPKSAATAPQGPPLLRVEIKCHL